MVRRLRVSGLVLVFLVAQVAVSPPGGADTDFVFPSPSEFLVDAWPAEPVYIQEHSALREALGLPVDEDIVAELITTPGARHQAEQYGTVLTKPEEELFAVRQQDDEAVFELTTKLSGLPGWAGSVMHYDQNEMLASLEVRFTKETVSSAVRAVTETPAAARLRRVDVVEVGHSWEELRTVSRVLGNASVTAAAPSRYSLASIEEAIRQLDQRGVIAVGYSIANNAIVAKLPENSSIEPLVVRVGELPHILVRQDGVATPTTGP